MRQISSLRIEILQIDFYHLILFLKSTIIIRKNNSKKLLILLFFKMILNVGIRKLIKSYIELGFDMHKIY